MSSDSTEGASNVEALPSPSATTPEEASEKLENHRCAICDKIFINACRIGCGHTFCRHCLNVHKTTRNERGKPICFICDAAITEISNNSTIDTEINELYKVLSIDERLARERAKAERKAEEEEFETKLNTGCLEQTDEGYYNDSTGSGDATEHSFEGEWIEEGYPEDPEMPDADVLTFYLEEEGPYAFWQEGGENSEHDEGELQEGDYEAGTINENDDVEERQMEEIMDQYPDTSHPQQAPIVIHHTIQHFYHTVGVQNSTTTYHGNEVNDERQQRRQLRHAQYPQNHFADERRESCRGGNPSDCRQDQHRPRTPSGRPSFPDQNFSGQFYQNQSPSPTYYSRGYYPYYTTRYAMPNFHYPNQHSNPLLSPMSASSHVCYTAGESYPLHPSTYAQPSSPAMGQYPDQHGYQNGFHRGPSNHSCECDNACGYHRTGGNDHSTSPQSSRSHFRFVVEETADNEEDDVDFCMHQERNDTNCQCEYDDDQSESDDQSPDHEHITLNLTIPVCDNITIRTLNVNDHRPSTCSRYILELE